MGKSFADGSIVMEGTTSTPTEYLRFEPNGLSGEYWLHRRDELDPTHTRDEVIDRYALPPSESYTVTVVEIPAGIAIRFGTVGASHGRTGGADLVNLLEYESIPSAWIRRSLSLAKLLKAQ
ncbi:hypothetical protein ACFQS4_02780 [Saliphagus sp. GCM10025317]